eukprot:scaffold26259_cov57-Attheya_sp.AAC.1
MPVKKDEGKKQKKKTRGQAKAEKEQKEFKLNDVLLAYFNDKKEISQNVFAKIHGVPRTTFQRHWCDCGLTSLKKRGACEEEAKHILTVYFAEKTTVSEKAREDAAKLCQCLTDDEQRDPMTNEPRLKLMASGSAARSSILKAKWRSVRAIIF